MHRVAISSTGLFTPPETITNEELVASFNRYVQLENTKHADAIAAGSRAALTGLEIWLPTVSLRTRRKGVD